MVAPQYTGTLPRQYTGTTTLARQFTGLGLGVDTGVARQGTGGAWSPTKHATSSPTKHITSSTTKLYDGPRPGAGRFPRPRSVQGTRSTDGEVRRDAGEGRGIQLIRQLTGGSTSFSGNSYGQ